MVLARILIVIPFTIVFVRILIVSLFTTVCPICQDPDCGSLYHGVCQDPEWLSLPRCTGTLYVRILIVVLPTMVFVRIPTNQLSAVVLAKDTSCKVNRVAAYLKVDRPHGKDSALVCQESDGGDPGSQLRGESGHFSSLVASESHALQIRTHI
jgi:hypothetical protein